MQGWIKLHRKIMESDTFSRLNAIQQLIAIYIILNANHEDGVWVDKYKGIEVPIKRGQLVTSRKKIVNEWFKGDRLITEQKVRTALAKLEKLGFLTCKSTNNYTLIEVLNYNVYQSNNEENNQHNNQEITKTQPRDNQGITTNKNDKNDKNEKNNNISSHKQVYEDDSVYMQLAKYFVEQIKKNNPNFKEPNYQRWANDIRLMLERDKRTEEQIRYLMTWVQQDDFEMANVLSPAKLRKRFDSLVLKVKTEREKKKKGYQSRVEKVPDWYEQARKERLKNGQSTETEMSAEDFEKEKQRLLERLKKHKKEVADV